MPPKYPDPDKDLTPPKRADVLAPLPAGSQLPFRIDNRNWIARSWDNFWSGRGIKEQNRILQDKIALAGLVEEYNVLLEQAYRRALRIQSKRIDREEELEDLQLDQKIATLKEQIKVLQNPPALPTLPKAEPRLTSEEKKARDKEVSEARLARLKTEESKAQTISDEAERRRKLNAIKHEIELEEEKWSRLL